MWKRARDQKLLVVFILCKEHAAGYFPLKIRSFLSETQRPLTGTVLISAHKKLSPVSFHTWTLSRCRITLQGYTAVCLILNLFQVQFV